MLKTHLKNLKAEFYQHQTIFFILFVFFMGAAFAFFATSRTDNSNAVSTDGFNPGNIISDAMMSKYDSMTIEEIQAFLTEKNPCNNRNYALYQEQTSLYPKISWHWSGSETDGHFVCLSEERFGEGVEIGEGETAAEIIYAAAQEYKINPQVLIVLLEKEQGLITDTYPHSNQYRSATGYGCPDTAACDTKYYGFKNQVFNAASLFRYTLDHGSMLYPDNKHGVFVAYNPSSSCGGTEVFIENRATSALYRYTPYQPNSAALAAGFGKGDICSAYGNRNFYLYFTKWFGNTQATVDAEPITIPNGEYWLAPQSSLQKPLGTSESNVKLTAETDEQAERWRLEQEKNNTYKITHIKTGKVLDLLHNKTDAGTNLQIWDSDNSCGQRWKIYSGKDNRIILESACASGMVVDVSPTGGENVELNVFSKSSTSQEWAIHAGQTIADGMYQIVSTLDSEQVLDINAGIAQNGTNITSWQQYPSKGHQTWKITYNSAGDYYTISNPYTGKNLDLNGGIARNGANIAIWEENETCAQKWNIISNHGVYTIQSLCSPVYTLDLNGSAVNGTNVSLWQWHGGKNQQWVIREAKPAVEDGIYNIVSKISDAASFDVINGINQDGANVAIWQLHGGQNQQWQVSYNPADGTYSLKNILTGLYLGIHQPDATNGDNVELKTSNDTCATAWYIYPESTNEYRITSSCRSGTAVDLNGGFHNGNNITIWQFHGGIHQRWFFVCSKD